MQEAIARLRPAPADEARKNIEHLVEQGRKAVEETKQSPTIAAAKTQLEGLAQKNPGPGRQISSSESTSRL